MRPRFYIGSVVVNVADIARARDFWTAALGYVQRDPDPDDDFVVLRDPERGWANLSLQLSDEPKSGRNRLHLDLYAEDPDAEVERLLKLGAKRFDRVPEPGEDFVVLEDPEGNLFCVVDIRESADSEKDA